MSKIYSDNGFINWGYLYNTFTAFMMGVGPRGTGKTYGLIKYLIQHKIRFLYVRRLQTQLDQSGSPEGNPFKKLNSDLAINVMPFRDKKTLIFYQTEIDADGHLQKTGDPVAYGVSLSTMANVRGVDYSDVDCILFDEAVPMIGQRPIKNEFAAFLNLVETVNRNRDIDGGKPVKTILLGNANRLSNPYFVGWEFMQTALHMLAGKQMLWRSPDNSRVMVLFLQSPISAKKRVTALYQNANDDFISMAIDNAFRTDSTNIQSYRLSMCIHLVSCGEIGIYKIKSRPGYYYVSRTVSKDVYYQAYGVSLRMFQRDYTMLRIYYYNRKIIFQSYSQELIFRELIGLI